MFAQMLDARCSQAVHEKPMVSLSTGLHCISHTCYIKQASNNFLITPANLKQAVIWSKLFCRKRQAKKKNVRYA